jgi:hypothetical protein
MKTLILALSLIGLIGCNQQTSTASANGAITEFKITDIRGDVLGMPLQDYRKKHPHESKISGNSFVDSGATYAGCRAQKSADFYHDQLEEITYSVNWLLCHEEIEKALTEKYGPPTYPGSHGVATWDNNIASILLVISKEHEWPPLLFIPTS